MTAFNGVTALWEERSAPCPQCTKPTPANSVSCVNCGYELNKEEKRELEKQATEIFKRSILIGGVTFTIFLILFVIVFK